MGTVAKKADDRSPSSYFWVMLGALTIFLHLGLIFYGLVPNLIARPIHMALALPWVLVFASQAGISRLTGIAVALVGIASCLWIAFNQSQLSDQYGFLENQFQIGVAICLLLVVIETARRAIGWPLPFVAVIALVYGLFGQYIPGEFGHSGTPLKSFLGTLTIAEGGICGSLTGISVGVVAIFVIFGAVLNAGVVYHRLGGEDNVTHTLWFWRAALAFAATYRFSLFDSRYGSTDYSCVCDLCVSGWTSADKTRLRTFAGPLVRVLVCVVIHHHTASLRGRVYCRWDGK
jgi:hypothetical protein